MTATTDAHAPAVIVLSEIAPRDRMIAYLADALGGLNVAIRALAAGHAPNSHMVANPLRWAAAALGVRGLAIQKRPTWSTERTNAVAGLSVAVDFLCSAIECLAVGAAVDDPAVLRHVAFAQAKLVDVMQPEPAMADA